MRRHRFYVPNHDLVHSFWLNDEVLVAQWRKVLRYEAGAEVILFDGIREDRLYRILEVEDKAAKLELITELVRQTPKKDIYLCWAMLKKDKNEWVLQKGTELGVSHFIPMITDRTEKTGFDEDRARKIVIEAAEQCGRSDIPAIREPVDLAEAIGDYADEFPLLVCEQGGEEFKDLSNQDKLGVLVGPEGGWSEAELQRFKDRNLPHLHLNGNTLRAETACLAAVTLLVA